MSDTLKHLKVSLVPDDPDTDLVRPSDWNHEHIFNGGTAAQFLQRYPANSDGVRWADGEGVDVSGLATGGDGTSGDPWTGWETAVEGLAPGSRIHFPRGEYTQTQQITMQAGWYIFGDSPQLSKITINGAIKGWVWIGASLTTHANISMRYLGLYGDSVNTLALIDINKGFHFDFQRLYLWNSTTYGMRALGILNLWVDRCDIEGNALAGLRLGDNSDPGNQYISMLTLTRNLFGGVTSTEGFMKLIACSNGLIFNNAFEFGTIGIALDVCGRLVIDHNFFEFGTSNCIRAETGCRGIQIINNHLHTEQDARVDLQFGLNAAVHETLVVEDNDHVAFGGSHTSVMFFDPGAALSFRYKGNRLMPESNRGLLPAVYVGGYPDDSSVNFMADVELQDPNFPAAFGESLYFAYPGEKDPFVFIKRNANDLEITTAVASSLLTITNGTQETVFGADESHFNNDQVVFATDGSAAFAERIFVQTGVATPAGGSDPGVMIGSAQIGIYWGSGAPTLTAAKGSLYIQTDGSSSSTRLHINTDGSTGWTSVTTAT